MKRICKNCIFWNNDEEIYGITKESKNYLNFGTCSNKKFIYTNEYELNETKITDVLIYWDYEGFAAGFSTGKDFGCKHFKKT